MCPSNTDMQAQRGLTMTAAIENRLYKFPYLFGGSLLGGPWDLVTTSNWASKPTYNPPKWAYRDYPNYK